MTPRQLLRKVFPPMLATLAAAPPSDDDEWVYELKYDGFRVVAAIKDGEAAMLSRNELDLAARFPTTFARLKKLKAGEMVVDGEIVVLDENGAPRFQLLQQGGKERLILFDILWLDGRDLRGLPYEERRRILETTLNRPPAGISFAERLETGGQEALSKAASSGWEGIIAKRRQSSYEGRRSKQWLKIKAVNQQELVVVGWQPSSAGDRDIGSLHLAYFGDDGKLHYAGKVGTGFSARLRTSLRETLGRDEIPKPMVEGAPRVKTSRWVRPRLIAEVSFTEWTTDKRLRHPSFLGFREDKAINEVIRETPAARGGPQKEAAAASRVKLTNPDRLLYPRDGITKKDVVAYYEAVAEPMIRALEDRPLALEHWNQGIDKPAWFQQNIGREGPDWLTYIETPTRTSRQTVRHLVADSVDALRWLAQMSVLTIHMWSSRGESLEEPDWLIFDLDPAKGKGIEQAIEAAGVMRRLLDDLELPAVPKTSGKRGIHVLVPLAPGYTHEQATEFACSVSAAVAANVPGITVERALAKRRGRLYLDCLQNGYGKTIVAPYSLRASDGAPVSAPLRWGEITKKLDPLRFNLRTMPDRIAQVGDLFAAAFENGARLPEIKAGKGEKKK